MSTHDNINESGAGFDAQLTAYALGELNLAEVAAVEQRLQHDPGARLFVEQTRQTAAMLARELAAEPAPELTSQQRRALLQSPRAPVSIAKIARIWFGAGFATAACLGIAVGAVLMADRAKTDPEMAGRELRMLADARDASGSTAPGQSGETKLGVAVSEMAANMDKQVAAAPAGGLDTRKSDSILAAVSGASAPPQPGSAEPREQGIITGGAGGGGGNADIERRVLTEPGADASKLQFAAKPAGESSYVATNTPAEPQPAIAVPPSPSAPPPASVATRSGSAAAAPGAGGERLRVVESTDGMPGKRREGVARASAAGDSQTGASGSGRASEIGARPGSGGGGLSSPGKPFGLNAGDDSGRWSQTSLSVTDIQQRIQQVEANLQVIQNALVSTASKLEGSTAPDQEDLRRAERNAAISLRASEIAKLRADLAAADQAEAAARRQRLSTLEIVQDVEIRRCVTQNLTGQLKELDDQRQSMQELIARLHQEAAAVDAHRRFIEQPNAEAYNTIIDNPFLAASDAPLSTFSVDVDTASYANLRRYLLQDNALPPANAVRIEEMLNYFPYDYAPPGPQAEHPFAVSVEINAAPWNPEHRLARIALKGREITMDQRPATSLVFLIDVSGSMQPPNKLPLLKQSMKMLVDQLNGDDRVAIVTYAGNSGLALPSTYLTDKQAVVNSIDNLHAGGSTNGGAGIQLAYDVAVQNFIAGGVNRVILATDGDFNVGVTDDASLTRLIEEKRQTGVFLSVLGFGEGNLNDAKMEQLADKGNGAYAYIDTVKEGRKVLVEQATGTLVTIAKDVKLQIEFNPAQVSAYRLIGYENRVLAKEDFNNDRKDAGDIGAGHAVTALYEIVPAGRAAGPGPVVDPLKYQRPAAVPTDAAATGEMFTLKLRYKQPDGQTSRLIEVPVRDGQYGAGRASADFDFAAAVASFGMILRKSPYRGAATLSTTLDLAEAGRGEDPGGYRTEFVDLVKRASVLIGPEPVPAILAPR